MKKEFGKLSLNKETISSLAKNELQSVRGGVTTSYLECTGITCCDGGGGDTNTNTNKTNTITGGDNVSCGLSLGCDSCNSRPSEEVSC